ncbi:acylneuraminate cytidylyltransferase family protein [Candidatus Pelagibacter sp. HIMB1493]|uniref:acylneuraminate cytidylyltransferase family protein n=1 Tax=Candidatus Pelagibacter sp. HIMB1493 TaxID=3413334 RepID=UPI003F868CA3
MKKYPCFILARKNSKGLKNKNIVKLLKKPLIYYTVKFAKSSKLVSKVIVSTDDNRISNIAKKLGCYVIYPRPKKLSNDSAKSEDALIHAINNYEANFDKISAFSYLQITEPLRPKNILDKCIKVFNKKKCDSVFAAFKTHKNYWIKDKKNYFRISPKKQSFLPRQIKSPVLREDTGVALITKKENLYKYKSRLGRKIEIIEYDSFHGLVDIHTSKDLKLAKILLKNKIIN